MQYVPPSRPTTPSSYRRPRTFSSATLKRTKRLQQLRATYSNAARGFLLKDYSTTLEFLEDSIENNESISSLEKGNWLESVLTGTEIPELELQRKLEILKITFIATIYNKSIKMSNSIGFISNLLELSPSTLIQSLWSQSIGITTPTEIYPTTEAANLHPSIAIALTLAALKLDQPRSARLVAEAWFGSVSSTLDDLIFDTAKSIDLSTTFQIQESSISMSTSGLKEKFPVKKALVGSWLRLFDLLTLHVLPKLGEWDAASDFIRLQSAANGGWVPEERIQAALDQLRLLQEEEVLIIQSKIQRQKDSELYKLEKERLKAQERKREKGKSRSKEDSVPSNEASTTSSPEKPKSKKIPTNPNGSSLTPKGFALLRSTLSTYLRRTTPLTPLISTELIPLSIKSFPLYLKYYYSTIDPIRLLSVLFFVFAVGKWIKSRKLKNGLGILSLKETVGVVLSRVVETAKMGTKVTSL